MPRRVYGQGVPAGLRRRLPAVGPGGAGVPFRPQRSDGRPAAGRLPVGDATFEDLDAELVDAFVGSVRRLDPQGRGRFSDRGELLRRSGVLHPDGRPTVAGVVALGLYPQQWFPRFVIQAAAEPAPGEPAAARARNQVTIDGPVPRMLDQAMAWARRTFDTYITVNEPDGSVRDRYAYPLAAFRELISNSIIHRDLNPWSAGLATEVRLRRDRLVIGNPGGLYGITVDRLGQDAVTSRPQRPAWSPSASTSTPQRPAPAPSKHSPAESPS